MMKRIVYSPNAWLDYIHWQKNNKIMQARIDTLTKEMCLTPFEGKGKPHPLKFDMSSIWTRRISLEHRLLYRVRGESIEIIQCRYHYA